MTRLSGTRRRSMGKSLSVRFVLLVFAVTLVVAIVSIVWMSESQRGTAEDKALAEARTLNVELTAIWDYVDEFQDTINFDSDGRPDFKHIYCAIAGKEVARRFTNQVDGYSICYIREKPRTVGDEPDEFEQAALEAFRASGQTEAYGVDEVNGERFMRYVSVLTIKRGCLDCHGEPAGEKDVTGFLKEGMRFGDLAGAVSIEVPLASYEAQSRATFRNFVIVFAALAVATAIVVTLGLRRWVTCPLERANVSLAKENEAKTDFLAVMSHELRTPLSSVIAYSELLSDEIDPADERKRDMVDQIKSGSGSLLELVNNTLDAAKLDAGSMRISSEEIDLIDLVGSVCDVAMPLARRKGIELTKRVGKDTPLVTSDWDALVKILTNLVSNAIKFTDEGAVTVSAGRDDRPGFVRLSVSDTGQGIRADELERVFGKYQQSAFRSASNTNGSGLGLYIVKTLAELLGGEVSVSSSVGEGSIFVVTIPVDDARGEETKGDAGYGRE